jgi:tRNA A64-2'-O-ribosylphosphate transferase
VRKSDDYRLLVLCSASRRVNGAEMSEGGYIQGAGDDSEGWAYGLTPPVFWANRYILKNTPEEELPVLIDRLVGEYKLLDVAQDATRVAPTGNLFIASSGSVDVGGNYDLVIDCNGAAGECDVKRLGLGCESGKLGSRDLRKSLDKVRDFVGERLGGDSSLSLLVVCESGKDLSAGTLLAIVCLFYNDEGMYAMPLWVVYSSAGWNGNKKLKISHRRLRCLAEQAFDQQAIHSAASRLARVVET